MAKSVSSSRHGWGLISNQRGFTLIELVIIIVILGILSTAAVVHYQDLAGSSKTSALRASLATVRESLSIWRMSQIVKTGSDSYPSSNVLMTSGEVLAYGVPPNPYQSEGSAPDSVVEGVAMGVVVGTRGGYAYNPATGDIWANTDTDVPVTCKNLEGKLHENLW